MTERSARGTLRVAALAPQHWPALEALFGTRGACGGCWCMLWRAPYGGARFDADKGEPNRSRLRALIERGSAHGALAFAGDAAVGWISHGPRTEFPYFERTRTLRDDTPGAWVVTCFFVPRAWRGRGVATRLLGAAIEAARAAGATRIDGFPVTPRAAKVPAAFAWTGVPALFEAHGFAIAPHTGTGRLVASLALRR